MIESIPLLALIGVVLTVYLLAWIAWLKSATVFVESAR